jgi:hypothetical protein
VSGWTIIAEIILIALTLWLTLHFAIYRGALRRGHRKTRRQRNGDGSDGTPMDAMALRISPPVIQPDLPGPKPWVSTAS